MSVWSMEMSAPQESDPNKHFAHRDRLIEVEIQYIKGSNFLDFEN